MRSTRSATSRQTKRSDAFARRTPGKQPGLAEDLEAVADPEHRPAVGGERGDGSHHRREARDRSAAQVVAVREAAGEDDSLDFGKLRVGVPDEDGLGAEALERERRVAVVVRAGEDDDGDARTACSRHAPVLGDLDLVALDQRVREQLLAHLLDGCARLVGRRRVQLEVDHPCRLAPRSPRTRGGRDEPRPPRPAGRGCPASGRTRTVAFIAARPPGRRGTRRTRCR